MRSEGGMIKLRDIFEKPVDRAIEGVIKADDEAKLMTNLQTIAESLNTKCRGRAWIIVTAQLGYGVGYRRYEPTAGDRLLRARFANRMPLNSADVAEVIQKRQLKKTESGISSLSDLYQSRVE